MKYLTKILLALTLFLSYTSLVLATESTEISDLIPEVKASEIDTLDQIEEQRKAGFEEQLKITIPEYTDNPSFIVTFTDPSPDESGIQFEIDSDKYITVKSPYTFPALSIGEHTLKIKFVDKDAATQVLEYDILIVPRAPLITVPITSNGKIELSGTGLAGAEIHLFISSNTTNYTQITDINSDGNWSLEINPEEGISKGIYTVTAYTRKYGYASDFSTPVVFEVGSSGINTSSNRDMSSTFSFKDISFEDIKNFVIDKKEYFIVGISSFFVGGILFLLVHVLSTRKKIEKKLKDTEQSIKRVTTSNEKTLREIFGGSKEENVEVKKEDIKKEEPKVVEEKKEEKVLTKEEFLKEYKQIDPDDSNGKEKRVRFKVSLTSQKEDN